VCFTTKVFQDPEALFLKKLLIEHPYPHNLRLIAGKGDPKKSPLSISTAHREYDTYTMNNILTDILKHPPTCPLSLEYLHSFE